MAMMILGITLSGVAASSVLALRMTRQAVRLEAEATRASAILDSLAADPGPTPGSSLEGRTVFEWTVEPTGSGWSWLQVRAVDERAGAAIVTLTGAWAAPPPLVVDSPGAAHSGGAP